MEICSNCGQKTMYKRMFVLIGARWYCENCESIMYHPMDRKNEQNDLNIAD